MIKYHNYVVKNHISAANRGHIKPNKPVSASTKLGQIKPEKSDLQLQRDSPSLDGTPASLEHFSPVNQFSTTKSGSSTRNLYVDKGAQSMNNPSKNKGVQIHGGEKTSVQDTLPNIPNLLSDDVGKGAQGFRESPEKATQDEFTAENYDTHTRVPQKDRNQNTFEDDATLNNQHDSKIPNSTPKYNSEVSLIQNGDITIVIVGAVSVSVLILIIIVSVVLVLLRRKRKTPKENSIELDIFEGVPDRSYPNTLPVELKVSDDSTEIDRNISHA
ncbi:unnamed protein product [Owenia fusiformis]|uniref:Uncharacterized protein n=1 Tax=Owenia fusiformis TaxID=6347 RepID=A0A8J1XYR3_OWEFU|nr:unnamed protein product [Owenia fusiformis]